MLFAMINGKEIPMCKHCNGLTFEKGKREKETHSAKQERKSLRDFLYGRKWNGMGREYMP
jgi:hypothetical protein